METWLSLDCICDEKGVKTAMEMEVDGARKRGRI